MVATFSGLGGEGIRLDMGGSGSASAGNITWTVLIDDNDIGVDNTGTAGGPRNGVASEGIQVSSQDHSGTLDLTITNNTIANIAQEGFRILSDNDASGGDPTNRIRIANNTWNNITQQTISAEVRDGAVINFDITGNSGNGVNGSPANEFEFEIQTASTISVTQASQAALSSGNSGASVSVIDGSLTFNTPVTPTLPMNP